MYLMLMMIFVAVALQELDVKIGNAITAAWSRNTVATRNSQWKSYLTFCSDHGLQGLPGSDLTIARFMLFKAKTVKFVTINNYLSAIISLHRFYGFEALYREKYFIKMVLEGLKSILGQEVHQKMSLSAEDLLEMHQHVKGSWSKERAMWYSLVVSFRSLLRKGNLLPEKLTDDSAHIILRRDVDETEYGYCINVHSTKTLKNRKRVLRVPLVMTPGSPLCAATAIKDSFLRGVASLDSPLFVFNGKPLLYSEVLKFLKMLVGKIGKDPSESGLHSMRRSGAQFLLSLGVPISEIMYMGDWSSLAVLSYLVTTYDKKVEIEHSASKALANLK